MSEVGKGRGYPKQDQGYPRIGLGEFFPLDKTSRYSLIHTGLGGTPSLPSPDTAGGMSLAVKKTFFFMSITLIHSSANPFIVKVKNSVTVELYHPRMQIGNNFRHYHPRMWGR